MSVLEHEIDFRQLEEELLQALRDDELYKLKNDAKIRAIEQKVPTYNDFREMVNGAHLKPLKRNDVNEKTPIPRNTFANLSDDWDLQEINYSDSIPPLDTSDPMILNSVPKDTKQFLNIWENISDSDSKFEYLLNKRVYFGKSIFLSEIPSEFLEDVIILCSSQISSDKMQEIVDVFIKLSECNRFDLNLFFLSEEKKDILKKLLEKIMSTDTKECQELAKKYKTILN